MDARYQILTRIGTTAGSDVYSVPCMSDQASPLLKLLPSNKDLPEQFARFRREYEILRSMQIAGVARPIELLEEEGRLAMVLQHVDGEPFASVLAR